MPQVPAEGAYDDDQQFQGKPRSSGRMLPILHPDAAGIDIGAEELFVAVPPDRGNHQLSAADWTNNACDSVRFNTLWR